MVVRKKFNYKRKAWHLLGLVIPIFYYIDIFKYINMNTKQTGLLILFSCLILLTITEYLRLKYNKINILFLKFFGALLKDSERTKLNGTLPYFFSTTMVMFLFPPEILILSMIFLVIGDPVAAWVGTYFGKKKYGKNNKTFAGLAGFALACMFGSLIFLYIVNTSEKINPHYFSFSSLDFQTQYYIVLYSFLITAVAEFFTTPAWNGFIDDNLIIPLTGSFCLLFFLMVIGKVHIFEIIKF